MSQKAELLGGQTSIRFCYREIENLGPQCPGQCLVLKTEASKHRGCRPSKHFCDVYASVENHIGDFVCGGLHLKRKAQGDFVFPFVISIKDI